MQIKKISLSASDKKTKKLAVKIDYKLDSKPRTKTIHFGQKGASDFTLHKDEKRKSRYEDRHREKEDWTKSGVLTAGFWAKNILWNKPTLEDSIKDTEAILNHSVLSQGI